MSPAARTQAQTLLSLNSLCKEYRSKRGRTVTALEDVSLDISHGEVVTLVGPSGCGKSTLLKLMAALHSPTSGDIRLEEQEHQTPSASIGIVYQQPLLLPWKTALENVLVPIRVRRMDLKIYR